MTAAPPAPIDWAARPKVLLHEHLDGGLRPHRGLRVMALDGSLLLTPTED